MAGYSKMNVRELAHSFSGYKNLVPFICGEEKLSLNVKKFAHVLAKISGVL